MKGLKKCQLKTLYVYELRKIVCRRIVWIAGGILLLLSAALSFADLLGTSVSIQAGNGEISITGYELMKVRRECARALSGRAIDDSLLQEMQDFYQGKARKQESEVMDPATGAWSDAVIGREDDGAEEENIEDSLWDGQKYTPVYAFVRGIMGEYEREETINAAGLYSYREQSAAQNRGDQMLTQEELEYWKRNDAGLEIPFIYEYTEGWGNLWNQACVLNCMLLLWLLVSLSNVFSMEHQQKTDAMILCSLHGKRELYIAKILAGITFGAAAALLLIGTALLSDLIVYGADGFGGALQIEFPLSSWRVSIGESVFILAFLLLVISVMYSIAILFLSEWVKKSAGVMAIPMGLMVFSLFIDIPYQFGYVSQVYDLLPTNLLMTWELWDDRLFPIFGGYLTQFQMAPILYVIFSAVLLFLGKKVWCRELKRTTFVISFIEKREWKC